jgi:integrase
MAKALIPAREAGREIALPEQLIAKAKDYAVHARAARTRKRYKECWRDFERWCETHGREPLPASVETVVAYATWMGAGRNDGKTLAVNTISQALSAIKLAQRTAGYTFDSDSPILKEVMKGIRRAIAKERTIRRVKPLMQEDLRDMLEQLRPDVLREARDAALLALGWAGALRRSELVGLDWGELGTGTGFVSVDEKGLTITLMTSKASQDAAQTVAIPRAFAPLICDAVENWVNVAPIPRGTPLFRGIFGRGAKVLGAKPLHAYTVACVIKRRVQLLANAKGRRRLKKDEVAALVEQFSGHSMRVGFVTSAAARDVPTHRIKEQTRHKSDAMVSVYIREVDKFKNSGLKGVGF